MGIEMEEMPKEQGSASPDSSRFICGVVEGFYGRPWTTEQRKNLFERMKALGLNTYLYAPKDDLKHRFEWRALYNEEESELLRSLIRSAKENNVVFVYSLSPGIDMIYSNKKEVEAVQKKLAQVRDMGCTAFALLFDDIEASMNEADRKKFPSFVAAQLSVANTVYSYIESEMFFFCPTEYCSSRAVPDLSSSDYLNTLGENLLPPIHIMWTGSQVVSPTLTSEHARSVAKVLRRKPLIWDNLHANDYDPRRVFLGPFKGREVDLKNEISGMLLNPNCKYEANFVPLYTMSVWNQSEYDEDEMETTSSPRAIIEEEMAKIFTAVPTRKSYSPTGALNEALDKWLDLYQQGPGPAIPPISQIECTMTPLAESAPETNVFVPPPTIRTCEGNELVETAETPQPAAVDPEKATQLGIPPSRESSDNHLPDEVAMEEDGKESGKIDHEQLALLVDMFYLPFDYGERGIVLLDDFQWMHKNAHVLRQGDSADSAVVNEWKNRFEIFQSVCSRLEMLFRRFLVSPNRSLVQEIFPYISEAHATTTILGSILKWMQAGNLVVLPSPVDSWWRNRMPNVEPWSFGNGLLSDMQKLIISSPEVANLLLCKTPIPLPISSYRIEPLVYEDVNMADFYENFAFPEEKRLAELVNPNAPADFFFERVFGVHFKCGVPPHHFRVDEIDEDGRTSTFAVITAIFSVPAAMDDIKNYVHNEFKNKYANMLNDSEERMNAFMEDLNKWPLLNLPDSFLNRFPSFVEIRWKNHVPEAAWVRRMFQSAASTLAMNGSNGLFAMVPSSDENRINLFNRFGLCAINDVHVVNGHIALGHLLQFSD
ncbi:Bifunctional protein NCOAT [Aphelenchoides fujianensis]|nr:Bifunctional protein NCOAT [Aphelenchoides fujianensis]